MSDLALVPRRVWAGRPRHHHADRSRPSPNRLLSVRPLHPAPCPARAWRSCC